MKDSVKYYESVGVVGYLIGFYEIKYKTIQPILKNLIEENKKDSEEKKKRERPRPLSFCQQ